MSENIDLVIRNAKLHDSEELVDIAIKGDKIVVVDKRVKVVSKKELDVNGKLTSPGFVDAHMHLDHAFIGGDDIWNGRKLRDALKISNRERQLLLPDGEKINARKVAEMALMNGTTALRAHVSVDKAIGLRSMNIMLELKKGVFKLDGYASSRFHDRTSFNFLQDWRVALKTGDEFRR